MGTNLLEEQESRSVQSVFRRKSQLTRYLALMAWRVRTQRNLQVVMIVVVALVVLVLGYAIGGGFSSAEPVAGEETPAGDFFITAEQAGILRQQSIELQEARSELAITAGEAAFLKSQNIAISDDVEILRSSLNEAQVEMSIIVGIYEECMDRLYPAECVASARPRADAFLADLYADSP